MSNQKKGYDYEIFIHELVKSINKEERNIECLETGKLNKIQGASGCKHQIDVSFVDKSFPVPTLILIECKNKPSKSVEKAEVATHKAIVDDIKNSSNNPGNVIGVFAYAEKARKGAKQFGSYYGVLLEKNRGATKFFLQI